MKLTLENGMARELSDIKVLAIIPQGNDTHIKCCGLNIRMNHNIRMENDFDNYITAFISNRKVVHGYIVSKTVKVPIDISGGNTNECYFGYINPTIFENISLDIH